MKQTVPSRTGGVLAAPPLSLQLVKYKTADLIYWIFVFAPDSNVVLLISTGYLEQNFQYCERQYAKLRKCRVSNSLS